MTKTSVDMDNKNYNPDPLSGLSKTITWEEYKKEFSVEHNLKNLEEFEVQLSSGSVEGEEFEVFMDRFKREHSWATN